MQAPTSARVSSPPIRTETGVADGSGRPHAFEFSPVLGEKAERFQKG